MCTILDTLGSLYKGTCLSDVRKIRHLPQPLRDPSVVDMIPKRLAGLRELMKHLLPQVALTTT